MKNDDTLFKIDQIKDIKISVKKAEGTKCPRCWKILEKKCQRCNEIELKN